MLLIILKIYKQFSILIVGKVYASDYFKDI